MQQITERIQRFLGLSNRDKPAQLTREESPDLLNIDLSEGTLKRRGGFTQVNSIPFCDSGIELDGVDDWLRAEHRTAYAAAGARYVAAKVELSRQLVDAGLIHTVIEKGFGSSTDYEFGMTYQRIGATTNAGWWFFWYDTTLGSVASVVVQDGTIDDGPVDAARFIEFDNGDLNVWDTDGNLVGTANYGAAVGWNSTTHPIFLGVNQASSETPGSEFGEFIIDDVRIGIYDDVAAPTGMVGGGKSASGSVVPVTNYEWNEAAFGSFGDLVAYWKFNDGFGTTITEEVSGNDFIAQDAAPTWTYDQSLVYGASGLRFVGRTGFVGINVTSGNMASLCEPVSGSPGSFYCSVLYSPELPSGATSVPDQTLFWMGTDTDPEPLGLRVVGNRMTIYWHDGTSSFSQAGTVDVSDWVGKRLGILFGFTKIATTSDYRLQFSVYDCDSLPLSLPGSLLDSGTQVISSAIVPTDRANFWTIGNHLSGTVPAAGGITFPFTYVTSAGGPALGTIDDFRVYASLPPGDTSPNRFGLLNGPVNPGQSPPGGYLALYLDMEEGEGSVLFDTGAFNASCFLHPPRGSGFLWTKGLMISYEGAVGRGIWDYRSFSQRNSTTRRDILVVAGTTVHSVDESTGNVTVYRNGVEKSGLCTFAQYDGGVFIGARNGQRPLRFEGNDLHFVGIEAPVVSGSATFSSFVGGFPDGTYFLYYSFYSDTTGAESNLSPGFQMDFTTSGAQITALSLPVSPDPQVTSRRVYMTNGTGDGTTAYLIYTEQNNTETSVGSLNIISLSTSSPIGEYTLNGPAPSGSVLEIFQDFLFIGGNQRYPTRLYFSQPGRVTAFSPTDFKVLESDRGDPIVGMEPRQEVLSVYAKDGRYDAWPTGITADPIDVRRTNSSNGAVSPQAIVEEGRTHVVVGEVDIYRTDGYNEQNISSPPKSGNAASPSIEHTTRTLINDSRREFVSAARHRQKNQMWFAVSTLSSTRNDEVLVYDTARGSWSRYDYRCDVLAELEDSTDQTWIYGLIRGYLCKLDDSLADGPALEQLAVSSTSANQVIVSVASPNGRLWENSRAAMIDSSTGTFENVEVMAVAGSVMYLRETPTGTYGSGDLLVLGGVPWYVEFVIGGSNPTKEKRLQWLTTRHIKPSTSELMNVIMVPNQFDRTPDWTDAEFRQIEPSLVGFETKGRVDGAFFGTTWRVRFVSSLISEAALDLIGASLNDQSEEPMPSVAGIEIFDITAEYIQTDAR